MNANLGKTEFTPEEIDDLRDRLKQHKHRIDLSWTDVAKLVGVPEGTLSQWVPGKYNGGKIYENQSIPGFVHRFFQQLQEQQALSAVMPQSPDFQMTPSAERMLTCMALAQLGDITMISTTPGCGKTAAVTQYRQTRSNVYVAVLSKATGAVMPVLSRLLDAMGEKDARGSPYALTSRIRAKVANASALIVIDEAQDASAQSLEELRAIHDATGCGIVLVGDDKLPALVKNHAQLHSRIGARHVQARPLAEDVTTLARAWAIEGGPERAFLQEIARKHGGLRTVNKTVMLAVRAARAAAAPLSVSDLRDAYAQRYADAA